jgi:hypothetical protein
LPFRDQAACGRLFLLQRRAFVRNAAQSPSL